MNADVTLTLPAAEQDLPIRWYHVRRHQPPDGALFLGIATRIMGIVELPVGSILVERRMEPLDRIRVWVVVPWGRVTWRHRDDDARDDVWYEFDPSASGSEKVARILRVAIGATPRDIAHYLIRHNQARLRWAYKEVCDGGYGWKGESARRIGAEAQQEHDLAVAWLGILDAPPASFVPGAGFPAGSRRRAGPWPGPLQNIRSEQPDLTNVPASALIAELERRGIAFLLPHPGKES